MLGGQKGERNGKTEEVGSIEVVAYKKDNMYVTHTHTHTPRCVCGLRRAKGRRLCARRLELQLLVQEPCFDLRSDQGRPSYGRRRAEIIEGGRAIGRAKKEGRNS